MLQIPAGARLVGTQAQVFPGTFGWHLRPIDLIGLESRMCLATVELIVGGPQVIWHDEIS
jgi:hypothetical protein